jgi:hypothetical protein
MDQSQTGKPLKLKRGDVIHLNHEVMRGAGSYFPEFLFGYKTWVVVLVSKHDPQNVRIRPLDKSTIAMTGMYLLEHEFGEYTRDPFLTAVHKAQKSNGRGK